MHRSTLLALALALSVAGALLGSPMRAVEVVPARPDIILFYIDDWAPYPARMWNSNARTPNLARFANRGLVFRNAIASTPLCGPSRANLLTGRYGHNNGVTRNNLASYAGSEEISTRLQGAGYRTAFIGKHMNGLARAYPTRSRMEAISSKWDDFDVMWHDQGRFYDWRQYRKRGTRSYGEQPNDHSSYQAAQRAVKVIDSTPGDQPVFMVISLYDGHDPNQPMPRFVGQPACRNMAWHGPAYNERVVDDKPRYVRNRNRIGLPSYSLRTRCEEALTVDWVVGRVHRALKSSGRSSNALQILTADNGYLMGDHRLVGKTYPYDTWVPLYMRWPAVLGWSRRVVNEPVSNVDLASTFCDLAGCLMPDSDGLSLAPLMEGTHDRLDRSFLYSEMLHPGPSFGRSAGGRPAWMQVHSTRRYADRLWSFTRYHTGEEELYDISTDPHRLRNLAGKPAHAGVLADMRGFWRHVRGRGDVRWKGNLP